MTVNLKAVPNVRFGFLQTSKGTALIWSVLGSALTLLIFIAAVSYRSISDFMDSARWVNHTHEVRVQVEELSSIYSRLLTAWRTYLIQSEAESLAEFNREAERLGSAVEELQSLTRDNPAQQTRLAVLERFLARDTSALSASITRELTSPGDDPAEEIARVTRDELSRDEILYLVLDVRLHEERLLGARQAEWQQDARRTVAIIIVGYTAGLATLIGIFGLLRREIRRRRAAEVAARHRAAEIEDLYHERRRAAEELKRLNEELNQRAMQLESANKELESFSYSVSHDLRSPLRAISSFARMLEEDCAERLDDEGRRLLKVIRDASRKMGQLIDDLLAFSRLGRKPIAVSRIDMAEQVRTALSELVNGDDRIRLQMESLPEAFGDAALIRQVWSNLLSNAIKFSGGRDEPRVTVSGSVEAEENVYCVKDNGAGFDMQYYDKLFGVFQRLHSADEFPGTGVGLAIVQRVVARHGGRVWAEGREGEGASFYFSLPRNGLSGRLSEAAEIAAPA